jgi:site-specific DNA-methyltransferase (adenine-specific)
MVEINAKIDLVDYDKDHDNDHPTQKPVDLLRYLVLTYTNPNDVVLDATIGSGTTAIACIKEHRHFVGFELNKEYFDRAVKRINDERRQLSLF